MHGGGRGHTCAHFVFLIAMSDYAHFVFLIAMSDYAYPFSEALHRISFLLPVGAEHIIYGKKRIVAYSYGIPIAHSMMA